MTLSDQVFSLSFLRIFPSFCLSLAPICLVALPVFALRVWATVLSPGTLISLSVATCSLLLYSLTPGLSLTSSTYSLLLTI